MIYNNIINHLKLWCIKKAKVYQKVSGAYGGVTNVGYLVAYELDFKLSTLIDKSFDCPEDLKTEILGFLDVHYEPSVLNPQNSTAKYMISKVNQEFCSYLDEVLSKHSSLSLAEVPYLRVIVGPEALALQDRFHSVWGYENTSYWFPLMGEEPTEVSEKFFIMLDYFKPYFKQFAKLIGLPHTHLYNYGECIFRPHFCIETDELFEYGRCETIYTDKDFSWALYFSHENTVAFAGSIVSKVKELLANEKEHWNKFEWDW